MKVKKLSGERVWRTYLGGSMIDKLHEIENGEDNHFPEEWIMSVTECRNAGREEFVGEGLSRLAENGEYLKNYIEGNPEELLGKKHYEKYGANTGVLVKIIDSSERLSIQVHPNREKALKLFDSPFGKTESWHILGGREINGEKPCIYFGFKKGVTEKYWREVFESQDIPKMLDCLNKIYVKEGDTFLIEGGIPHAIGAGCFLIEVQEPTDFTIRTERTTPSGFWIDDRMCHQGIGFDGMFECFNYDYTDIENYFIPKTEGEKESVIIGYDKTDCFMLREITVRDKAFVPAEAVFSGIYVLEGEGSIVLNDNSLPVQKGEQFFIPANTGFEICAGKTLRIMRFNGPKV